MRKHLYREIQVLDAKTSPKELIIESLTNFIWGLTGNSIVVFMAKGIDAAVFLNFLLYYGVISYIINRTNYQTRFGKFIFLPITAALGAFTGYKLAQFVSSGI